MSNKILKRTVILHGDGFRKRSVYSSHEFPKRLLREQPTYVNIIEKRRKLETNFMSTLRVGIRFVSTFLARLGPGLCSRPTPPF